MSRRVSTRALVAHHLRSRPGGGITVAALVLLLSLLATSAPIALTLLGDASLRERLSALSPTERDVDSDTPLFPQMPELDETLPTETAQVWGPFLDAVEDIRAEANAPLPALLGPAQAVALAGEVPLAEDPRTKQLRLAFDPAFDGHVRIVDGAPPQPATRDGDGLRVEVVLSTETARELEWAVGEERHLAGASVPFTVVLSGTFDAVDDADPFWQHVPSVLTPNIFDDGNGPRSVTGTAFAHPASMPVAAAVDAATATSPRTLVWYPLDLAEVQRDTAEQTAAALRKFTSVAHRVGSQAGGVGILALRFTADVTAAIDSAVAQQAATAGVIAMIVAGPVGVAAAVVVLGCRLIVERRRPSLRLLSARGAATGQLRGLLGLEGAIVGVLPAVVGAALAILVGVLAFGVTPSPLWLLAALLIGIAPVGILMVLAPSAAERQARSDLGRRGSRLRLIVEGIVAGLAAVALALLFFRGYGGGVDLLLAATPLLLSLVACLVTLRVYPLPLRSLFSRARRSPGLDAFLGSARALREPAIGLTPVLALVVGVSVAVSSGVLLSALQVGIGEAARGRVGADLSVSGASFTREQLDAVRSLEGVAAATGISGADPSILDVNGEKRPTSVFVVDAADLRDVQGGGPGMLPPGATPAPSAGAMPIVVAAATGEFIDGSDELRVGSVDAEVVGIVTGPVPVGERENWVALDSSYAEEVLGRDPTDRTLLLRLEPGASAGAVEAELGAILGAGLRIGAADRIVASIEQGPAVQGVRIALLTATGLAALLSALAIVMTLTIASGARGRVLALLRTLGARRRSATSVALWEVGPPAIAAVVAGTLFGALVPLVVLAAVDLRPFTGSRIQPAYALDAATLALTLGGFLLLAAVFTTIALLASRGVRAASALRTVEEG